MNSVLLDFYFIHTNIFAVIVLLLMFCIFFILKKNWKFLIIFGFIAIALNVILLSKTNDKAWQRDFYRTDEYMKSYLIYDKVIPDSEKVQMDFRDSMKVIFAAGNKNHPWVVYAHDHLDGSTKRLHWCWVDDMWERFSQTDLVSWIWGENASKKVRSSTEARVDEASGLGN